MSSSYRNSIMGWWDRRKVNIKRIFNYQKLIKIAINYYTNTISQKMSINDFMNDLRRYGYKVTEDDLNIHISWRGTELPSIQMTESGLIYAGQEPKMPSDLFEQLTCWFTR